MPHIVPFMSLGPDRHATSQVPHSPVRSLSGFVLPVLILASAHFIAPLADRLPASLTGLTTWGPLIAMALAGTLALAFNRGRVVFAVVSLAAAFAAYRLNLMHGLVAFPERTVFAAICLFVPLNLATLSVLRERGVFTFFGVRRLGSIGLQAALTAWVVSTQSTHITEWAYRPLFESLPLTVVLVPQLGLALVAAALVTTVGGAVIRRSAIDAGLAGALMCFALACEVILVPHYFEVYVTAAAATLCAVVVQDTYRLAFRDELTGLPSRRALNERLLTLGPHFTLAMVDIDHFKRFNDAHGHELGDQVLRMVGTKLARIGAGGRAYRYGGEEFIVLFPGKGLHDARPHLEALRNAIYSHPVVVRAQDRPVQALVPAPTSASARTDTSVSVTVSIGIVECNARLGTPAEMLRAADKALYRAKQKGRDRISN